MVLAGLTSRWQRGPCLLPVTQEETVSSPPALPGAPACLAPSSKPQPPVWSSPQLALASLTSLTLLRMLWICWSHLDHPEPPPCLQVSWRRTSVPFFLRTSLGVIILPTTGNTVKNQTESNRATISSSLSFHSISETDRHFGDPFACPPPNP